MTPDTLSDTLSSMNTSRRALLAGAAAVTTAATIAAPASADTFALNFHEVLRRHQAALEQVDVNTITRTYRGWISAVEKDYVLLFLAAPSPETDFAVRLGAVESVTVVRDDTTPDARNRPTQP